MRALDQLAAETGFSGVVRVDLGDEVMAARAYGLADRGWDVPNEPETRFGLASGTKGLTALTFVSLVEHGALELSTPVRTFLAEDLPLIRDDVTVEHLLAHRSGIGDFDEDAVPDPEAYVLPVSAHELDSTEAYVRVLDSRPATFTPGDRFAYSNSGYVVLALVAERASGTPFVSAASVEEMVRPRSQAGSRRYGLGFWLDASGDVVMLEGMDAGVSFRSLHGVRLAARAVLRGAGARGTAGEVRTHADALAAVLVDCVEGGASVGDLGTSGRSPP
ncbi:MAG: beta-lactamase family protein [Thermoleophilia bacterium]|nr:beta-lactamase family protein [Thermoleophilia bacterium]